MNRNTEMNVGQVIGTMNGLQVVGLDIAKQVFQLHTVEMNTGEIVNVQLKRAKVLERFANKPASLIAIKACGGAHHWARELSALGHSVRLLHAKIVRPLCQRKQNRCNRCARNLAGGPAARGEVCRDQDHGPAGDIDAASPTRGVDENADHANQRVAWIAV